MSGQKPRQGWIYMINPHRVCLRCQVGHTHIYDLNEPGEYIQCQQTSCTLQINSSRVLRGEHPHIIWTSNQFQDESNYRATFTVIPLTSQETYKGLPTVYPINATARNNLNQKSHALVHQICTVEANCFKDRSGNWLQRIGQLGKSDKASINERLRYFLDIPENSSEDWLANNASPELLRKVFYYLPKNERSSILEELIDDLDS